MSPAPEPARTVHRPSPVLGTGPQADVIDISPWLTHRSAATTDPGVEPWEETVVLGRAVPYGGPVSTPAATSAATAARPVDRATTGSWSVAGAPVVDPGGLHQLIMNRRNGFHPAPPPPRIQHRRWMLSSVVIAGGGVLAVRLAGTVADLPTVAMIALIATVLCGALLVTAQFTEEVRRARNRRRSPLMAPPGHTR